MSIPESISGISLGSAYVRPGDVGPITSITYIAGGWITVDTTSSLNDIDQSRTSTGQIAYVSESKELYIAKKVAADWITTFEDSVEWYEFGFPGGVGFPFSGSAVITGSLLVSQSFVDFTQATVISGSIFSGSFVGDGSGLTGIASSLYLTGSSGNAVINLKDEALLVTGSSDGIVVTITNSTASFTISDTAIISGSFSGSYSGTIDNAVTASHAVTALTASYAVSASYAVTASHAVTALTASYAFNASSSLNAITASHALTASSADAFLVRNDLTVQGIVTAKEFHTEFVSASIIYQSGSTQFGDTSDDTHTFTGSLNIQGDIRTKNSGRLYLWNDNSNNYLDYNNWISSTGDTQTIQNTGNGGITFKTLSDTRMFISSSGNIGIGDITPNQKLVVSGSISASGDLYVGRHIYDSTGTQGTAGQFLKSTTNGVVWSGATTAEFYSASYYDFDALTDANAPAYRNGRLWYDSENGALAFYNEEADITLQLGQEFYVRAYNNTTSSIVDGTPVYISGSQGDYPYIWPAYAEDHTEGAHYDNHILGIATHTIEASSAGYVTRRGVVRNVNTTAFNAGDILYLQTGSAGFRNTPPPFPYDIVQVGFVVRSHSNGFILVEPSEPVHFNNISGLSGSAAVRGDLWVYQDNKSWTPTHELSGSYTIATGSLGIGTASPNQLLHVVGGTAKIESDGGNASGAILELKHANNNTTDVCATINLTNNVGGYAAIEGGTTGANNTGYIGFKTDNAGTQGERMRITGDGNVGIGTTAPVGKLEVAYETFATYSPSALLPTQAIVANRNTSTSGSQGASLQLYATGHKGSTTGAVALNAIQELGNSSTGTFTLQTRNAGTYAERMRVQYDGNVGIGTTTPSANLDVADSATSVVRLTNTDTTLSEGQITGQVEFYQQDSTGGGTGITGKIAMRSAVRPDSGTYFGNVSDMAFFVSGTGTGQANDNATKEAMTIRAGRAYVGIGTTDPASKLEVYNDGIADIRISGNQETDTRIGGISWYNITGSEVIAAINVDRDGANDAGAITFDTQPAGGGNTERMRIDSTGKIKFNAYGQGNITGSVAKTLGVDANGNVIELASSTDGLGSGSYVAYWNDENTLTGSGDFTWTNSVLTIDGTLEANEKSFNIPHPTQPGKRLIYGVLEGPEHAVYVRGKISGEVIELPEEWTGLVHQDTITVQLTPIGKHQSLYVADIRDNKIFIKNGDLLSSKINAYYYIQGTRKDTKPLQTVRDK